MRVSSFGVLLGLCLVWVGAFPAQTAESKRLRIVTTIVPLYSWTKQIVGNHADVENLLPGDVGPHNYSFRPRDLRRLQNADLIIVNGLGLEEWLDRAIENTGGRQRVVFTSAGLDQELIHDLPTLHIHDPDSKQGHQHSHGHQSGSSSSKEESAQPNPHIWLDPVLAMHGVNGILEAVMLADPPRADAYRENAKRYLEVLANLDRELAEGLQALSIKSIVTYHDAFPYFARRYGLELVGVVEQVPSVDPSPKYLADLMKVIRARNVQVIFTEPQFNPRLAKRLTEDLGVRVAELDVLETGVPSADLYEVGMRKNLETLVRQLK